MQRGFPFFYKPYNEHTSCYNLFKCTDEQPLLGCWFAMASVFCRAIDSWRTCSEPRQGLKRCWNYYYFLMTPMSIEENN